MNQSFKHIWFYLNSPFKFWVIPFSLCFLQHLLVLLFWSLKLQDRFPPKYHTWINVKECNILRHFRMSDIERCRKVKLKLLDYMISCEWITKRYKAKGKNDFKNIFYICQELRLEQFVKLKVAYIYIYVAFLPASLKTFWLQKIQHQPL